MSVFPAPSGPLPVGILRTQFSWQGSEAAVLPLTFFYPAQPQGQPLAQYAFAEAVLGQPVGQELTHFYSEPPLADAKEKYPLLFYSHGYASYEMSNSILCGNLASHGYIVAALGHTGEATAGRLADGTVIPINPVFHQETYGSGKEAEMLAMLAEAAGLDFVPENDDAFIRLGQRLCRAHGKNARMAVWVEHIRAAADFAQSMGETHPLFAGRFDMALGLGATGHSFGGAAAIPLCRRDSRFVCGIDIDGANLEEDYAADIAKPFLCIGNRLSGKLLRGVFLNNTGDAWQLLVDDVEHLGFTDLAFFPQVAQLLQAPLGDRDPRETTDLLTRLHLSFFNHYLLRQEPPPEAPDIPGLTLLKKQAD